VRVVGSGLALVGNDLVVTIPATGIQPAIELLGSHSGAAIAEAEAINCLRAKLADAALLQLYDLEKEA